MSGSDYGFTDYLLTVADPEPVVREMSSRLVFVSLLSTWSYDEDPRAIAIREAHPEQADKDRKVTAALEAEAIRRGLFARAKAFYAAHRSESRRVVLADLN